MAGDGSKLLDIDLIEDKFGSSLALELRDDKAAACLPFAIMVIEKRGSIIHFFRVDTDADDDGLGCFGVVTDRGWILVYDTMFGRIIWKQQINAVDVNWADLWKNRTQPQVGKPTIVIHSRQSGAHLVVQEKDFTNDYALRQQKSKLNTKPKPRPIFYEAHKAFCKTIMCSDGDVLVPVGMNQIGVLNHRYPLHVFTIHTFPATIMAIKEVGQGQSSKRILCTAEDGSVSLLDVKWENNSVKATLLASMILPKYDLEQQPVGICIEGRNNFYVIGTHTKCMFIIQVSEEGGLPKLTPFGKKMLPTDGVSCLAMMEGKGQLAAGCFDGAIRLFSFPEMSRISKIKYHKSQVNALMFVNEMKKKDGPWYLLSSAKEQGVFVWTIPNEAT